MDSEKFNNIPFEEKSNLKKRKTNLNLKSENKKESINLGLEDFDENLKKKLEKNFEENTKEINEININVNDLTINLKSSNQAVKFSNEIFKSEEETKIINADNTGVKLLKCINIKGNKKYGLIGDLLSIVVNKFRMKKKLLKKHIYYHKKKEANCFLFF